MTTDVYHGGGKLASVKHRGPNQGSGQTPRARRPRPWARALAVAMAWSASASCACLSLMGCEEDDALSRARRARASASPNGQGSASPATVASTVRALAEKLDDAGALEPTPRVGDLAAELERFTTLDACVESRKIDDPLLGDAILALGYEGFAGDACRVLQAAKQKTRDTCKTITVSTLQRHCEMVVAVVAKDPEQCPNDAFGRAREATCLALASRDRRLCAAVDEMHRPRCEAMLAGDPKRCAGAGRAARATCERDAARWRTLLGDPSQTREAAPAALVTPAGRFKIEPKPGAPMRAGKGEGDLTFELRQGVVVYEERSMGPTAGVRGSASASASMPLARRIDIGPTIDSLPLYAPVDPTVSFSVVVPPDSLAKARVRKLDLAVPGGGVLSWPNAKGELTVTVKRLDAVRGGGVELTIEGAVGEGDRSYGLHLEAKTFVRDVVQTTLSSSSGTSGTRLPSPSPKLTPR